MDNPTMIDTDAMYAIQQALYREGVARSNAMVRQTHTELKAAYARTDAMVRQAQEHTRSLMKVPIRELDDIRFQ